MRTILRAALAALIPVAAGAQDHRLDRLDPATRAVIVAVVDSARRAGLPEEPLLAKALEGASKGAEGARIVAAVRRLAGHLGVAREALGGDGSAVELDAAAAALIAGATPADLTRLRSSRPRQSLVVPLGVLTDLVSRGVPADSARRVVLVLAGERLRDEDFVTFRRNVERDIALGAPAGTAASVRVNEAVRSSAFTQTDASAGPTPGGSQPRRRP